MVIKQEQMATDTSEMKQASRNIINRLDVPSSDPERDAKKMLNARQKEDVLQVSNFISHMKIYPLEFRVDYRTPRTW
jgi:hypothetical protein